MSKTFFFSPKERKKALVHIESETYSFNICLMLTVDRTAYFAKYGMVVVVVCQSDEKTSPQNHYEN